MVSIKGKIIIGVIMLIITMKVSLAVSVQMGVPIDNINNEVILGRLQSINNENSLYLDIDGRTLSFDETLLNATISDIATGESTYNATYNSLVVHNSSLWTEALNKYNISYESTYNESYRLITNETFSNLNVKGVVEIGTLDGTLDGTLGIKTKTGTIDAIHIEEPSGTEYHTIGESPNGDLYFSDGGQSEPTFYLTDGGDEVVIQNDWQSGDLKLLIQSDDDAVLYLEADVPNFGENDNAFVFYSQDGASVTGLTGFHDSYDHIQDNSLLIANLFNRYDGDIELSVASTDASIHFFNGANEKVSIGSSGIYMTSFSSYPNNYLCRSDTSGGAFIGYCGSSQEWKEDIVPVESATNLLMQMQPVSYKWIEDKSGKLTYGFIAEDLNLLDERLAYSFEQEVPVNLTGQIEEHVAGLNIDSILAVAVATIQEQQDKINELETRIKKLEGVK